MSNIKNNNKYSGKECLENIIDPYLKKYHSHIIDLILNINVQKNKVCDFGAGCGTLAKILKKEKNINPVCVEIDQYFISVLKNHTFEVFDDINKTKTQFDLIYSSNVLEHIEDHKKTLKVLKTKLEQDGVLVLYLPAFDLLFSDLDRKVGHFRRYSKSMILQLADEVGFKIDKIFYVDSIGFFGSLFIRIFGWNEKNGLGSKYSLIFYDKYIFPISKFFDYLGFSYFFGKNIFVSLRK